MKKNASDATDQSLAEQLLQQKPEKKRLWTNKKVNVPSILQMEAIECGAASLAMVLAYYGRYVPLETLRVDCGVNRDGSKASNVLKAARKYGLEAKGYRKEPGDLKEFRLPMIIFWNFNHFVVLTGMKGKKVYINDPAMGPRVLSYDEFDQSFTGVVLTFEPTPAFEKGGQKPSVMKALAKRLQGVKLALTYAMLAGLFLVIPGLVIPTFQKIFIDNILVEQMHGWLRPLLVAMGLTAIVKGLLVWLQQHYLLRSETKLALSWSAKFFRHVFRLPVAFFFQRQAGDVANRVQLNDQIAELLSGELATNMLNIIMIVFYAILMFQYDVVLTLLGISIALLNVVMLQYVSKKRVLLTQTLQQDHGKLIGTAMSGLQMIETLKATGSESDFFASWAGYQAKVLNSQQKLGKTTHVLNAVPPFLSQLNNIGILVLGGLRIMQGHLSMGELIAFQTLMSSFISPVNQMVNLGAKIQETTAGMNRLDDVFKHEPDYSFRKEPAPELRDEETEFSKLAGYLELKNVTFGYSHLEAPLIEGFSLSLRPGQRVALVGGSGSGKSTVAKLVTGLYQPWDGDIFFDGKPREAYPRRIMKNSLTAVDQEIFIFAGTVRENLTLWDRTVPEQQIVQAARDACIHYDIGARPGAYESEVEEGGQNFSGGQRQRLEIARALVNNPSLLILDEATSALDTKTEKTIDDNIRRRGCTTLVVAHRLSTIRDADEIIVLDKGKVVQRGTHEEMIQDPDSPYAKLIQSH
ncbi:NHLP family bacteriocin export ABC transporter peptidase/permease/ATPase subunit [candidate division KSB3 bacterium]|uniref:NHLP family bacteriocin export ABC transporter peptidase/permease/ATPase subunit n=1 Tax=candidate division KSB3 bacterium TaxID=2044937 RepID=A0A9D5JYP5_9BACT|nr:NHLP family bacteriocin export ABC transporter peptidase/permease/ATPase subunit [candidate division KSB3 bacterium]MBD3326406.1 NHLP family bacteriocin export ABC transporter peptidase/permease/ATPase subunit [candidate division KSB3 bacterium]